MQIKDVHVMFYVLLNWFIQKSGEYVHMSSEDHYKLKDYFFWHSKKPVTMEGKFDSLFMTNKITFPL